jgi:hypothetical protein
MQWKISRVCFTIVSTVCFWGKSHANDGAFYAAGNHLIPIQETTISVTKEILSMKKVNNDYIDVTVYYEFFNPGQERTITVGFEAGSPMGDVDGTPRKGEHPYLFDFTVQMNQQFLKYAIAYVDDTLYARTGEIRSKDLKVLMKKSEGMDYQDFGYVYYFKANFKAGKNILQHTYRFHVSNSVDVRYSLRYVLTAAKRWGNKQIDDFTLILDMGEFETFNVYTSFFKSISPAWTLTGTGKSLLTTDPAFIKFSESQDKTDPRPDTVLRFHIRKGLAIYQQKNFRPAGELDLFAETPSRLMRENQYLPLSIDFYQNQFENTNDEFLRKVYRNVPFARREFIFQSNDLKSFFEKMDWYMPDPNYQPDVGMLDEREKKWIARWQ